jgi:hypothetical protein
MNTNKSWLDACIGGALLQSAWYAGRREVPPQRTGCWPAGGRVDCGFSGDIGRRCPVDRVNMCGSRSKTPVPASLPDCSAGRRCRDRARRYPPGRNAYHFFSDCVGGRRASSQPVSWAEGDDLKLQRRPRSKNGHRGGDHAGSTPVGGNWRRMRNSVSPIPIGEKAQMMPPDAASGMTLPLCLCSACEWNSRLPA